VKIFSQTKNITTLTTASKYSTLPPRKQIWWWTAHFHFCWVCYLLTKMLR